MIRERRMEKKLTLEELANRSGISRVSLNRYELGQRIPNVVVAQKIANVLDCTIEELLAGKSDDEAV